MLEARVSLVLRVERRGKKLMCSLLSSRSCLSQILGTLAVLASTRRGLLNTHRQLSCSAVQKLHMLVVLKEREVPLPHILIEAGAHKALGAIIFCEYAKV